MLPVGIKAHGPHASGVSDDATDLTPAANLPEMNALTVAPKSVPAVRGECDRTRGPLQAAHLADLLQALRLNAFDLRQRHFPARQCRLVDVQLQPLWSPLQR